MASKSLTGTWGSSTFGPPAECSLPQTTTRECYDMAPKFQAADVEKNKFAKFNTLKNAGQLTLKPQNMCLVKNSDDGSSAGRFLTTQQVSYGLGDRKKEFNNPTGDDGQVLAAVGRSGARQERGLQGSGLTGEVLNTSSEPSKNSFVQRMWMYQDDSALYHRQNGVPEAPICDGLSFPIGENEEQRFANVKKSYARSSTDLMFSSIKKTGYKIFQDDEHGETANLEYHYKC